MYRVCLLKPKNLPAWLIFGSGAPAPRWEKQPRGRGNFPCGHHHEPGAAVRRAPCFPQRRQQPGEEALKAPSKGGRSPNRAAPGAGAVSQQPALLPSSAATRGAEKSCCRAFSLLLTGLKASPAPQNACPLHLHLALSQGPHIFHHRGGEAQAAPRKRATRAGLGGAAARNAVPRGRH